VSVPWALVGDTLTPSGSTRAAVVVRGEKIAEVVRDPVSGDLPADRREFCGLLCPGFIDLQVNGAFGADVGPDPRAVATLSAKLPSTGVTSFLPTLISSPSDLYGPFLASLERDGPEPGARSLGAHLEGPFLAPSRKGAHDAANLRPVDKGFLRELLGAGRVRVVTLAPELPRAREAIELVREGGAVASAGHTDAAYEEVLAAVDAGLELGTHLFNAMSGMGHRAPGAVGALLASERVRAGVVPDGVHVHEGALRVAYRVKGPENLALVTDAMAAAGMPPGDYELGGRRVRLKDGAVRLSDGTLAGSALTMDRAVRNAAGLLGIPRRDAVRMATETPADVLGMREKGRITPGADADLVLLAKDGTVQETVVAGVSVYRREEES
jgi:N-acetylglucosamine-6-phosphate deacetylase